jgi:amino acid transporter
VAYATQEILSSLSRSLSCEFGSINAFAVAGACSLNIAQLAVPVAIGIAVLLVLLAFSYQQTIMEYPSGGGAYTVAKENLGEIAAQTAGVSLLIGYVLTVAVSVSSGIAAITAVNPSLALITPTLSLSNHKVHLALLAIVFIAVINLRGVKESGRLFAIPTYGFILCIIVLLGIGFGRWFFGTTQVVSSTSGGVSRSVYGNVSGVALTLLFMRAYSAGCTALTGVEAISNGVTAFKDPAGKNAAKTLICMVFLLGIMFLGITILTSYYNIGYGCGTTEDTLLSMLTRKILSDSNQNMIFIAKVYYYLIQGFTFAILIVAANTAYAGFPRLAALHAKDGYLPKQFASVGDRLVLSNGIVILSILAGWLVIYFHADTSCLLPLYAIGVFSGFTISQIGMVVHWYVKRGNGWRFKLLVNGVGGAASMIVMLNIAVTKFFDGAGVVIILAPILVAIFFRIHRHYIWVKSTLAASRTDAFLSSKHHAIVLVSNLHAGVVQALTYARLISGNRVEALTVDLGSDGFHESPSIQKLRADWTHYGMGVPLRSVPSPYRRIVEPIIDEVDKIRSAEPEICLTVILPEVYTNRLWQRIFHNQMAFRIKTILMTKPGVIVTSVRMHLHN